MDQFDSNSLISVFLSISYKNYLYNGYIIKKWKKHTKKNLKVGNY